ncbi:hypothetical protein Tph_c08990 [Thermacetogenium phaeum DSM 12270]|uniref:Uncharacterized protein n=1 Tax=Thermacetogenium phaeum (strain ATCC BAA-254 / DSM 26808 / PB) TaxID=1089553 RepID=K4LST6_THEPS|nr:hypothetical protein Tph_c08990 [Thermacetogenium phaeum DSM 12270]
MLRLNFQYRCKSQEGSYRLQEEGTACVFARWLGMDTVPGFHLLLVLPGCSSCP